jgi:hypothetical protein
VTIPVEGEGEDVRNKEICIKLPKSRAKLQEPVLLFPVIVAQQVFAFVLL